MRNLNADFIAEKNKQTKKPITLYILHAWDGTNNEYLTSQPEDVTFDSQLHTAAPISHDAVSENRGGEVDKVSLRISNVARLMQAKFESYDFRNVKVTIKTIFLDTIDTPAAVTEEVYYVDSYDADVNNAVFSLSSKWNVLDYQLPGRKYARNYCQWKFKSTECAYSGGETECNKSLTRCKVLNNQERFGGFPGIPSKRLFIR